MLPTTNVALELGQADKSDQETQCLSKKIISQPTCSPETETSALSAPCNRPSIIHSTSSKRTTIKVHRGFEYDTADDISASVQQDTHWIRERLDTLKSLSEIGDRPTCSRQCELLDMITLLLSMTSSLSTKVQSQATTIAALYWQRSILLQDAEDKSQSWQAERDGWERSAEAIIVSQRKESAGMHSMVGYERRKDKEEKSKEREMRVLKAKLTESQTRLRFLESELARLPPLLLMQPVVDSQILPHPRERPLTGTSNPSFPAGPSAHPGPAPRSERSTPLRATAQEPKHPDVQGLSPYFNFPYTNFSSADQEHSTAHELLAAKPAAKRKSLVKDPTLKKAPYTPLTADARAEHLLLAAKVLGRKRAGLVAGMIQRPEATASNIQRDCPAPITAGNEGKGGNERTRMPMTLAMPIMGVAHMSQFFPPSPLPPSGGSSPPSDAATTASNPTSHSSPCTAGGGGSPAKCSEDATISSSGSVGHSESSECISTAVPLTTSPSAASPLPVSSPGVQPRPASLPPGFQYVYHPIQVQQMQNMPAIGIYPYGQGYAVPPQQTPYRQAQGQLKLPMSVPWAVPAFRVAPQHAQPQQQQQSQKPKESKSKPRGAASSDKATQSASSLCVPSPVTSGQKATSAGSMTGGPGKLDSAPSLHFINMGPGGGNTDGRVKKPNRKPKADSAVRKPKTGASTGIRQPISIDTAMRPGSSSNIPVNDMGPMRASETEPVERTQAPQDG